VTTTSRLITPPQEDEIYPYRRAWFSIAVESGILFVVTVAMFVTFRLLGVRFTPFIEQIVNLSVVLLPLVLWGVFSLRRELSVPLPRARLLMVLVVTGLAANAVGLPIADNIFQVDRWLPLADAPVRVVGYIITLGSLQEIIKYLVVRYATFPELLRIRADSVAYSAASAIGYAVIVNLRFALDTNTDPGTLALESFATFAFHLVASVIVAYGLSELRFSAPSPLLLPVMVVAAAVIHGAAIPIHAGLTNAGFSLAGSFTNPVFGLIMAVGLLVSIGSTMAFLFQRAEIAAQEARAESERAP
jgi:hypothetical protein